jgi:peroxiredoxin Q/BCP
MPLVDPGKAAPAFALADQHGAKHALKDQRGRPVVIYFYPKDDTPGCTTEACAFRDLAPRFDTATATVFGVSPDDVQSHAKFAAKYDLGFPLLADPPKDGTPPTCAAYGVWREKTMYGRTSMGVVRTTYLIDGSGKVAQRWDNVKVAGHAEEVLAAVTALNAR